MKISKNFDLREFIDPDTWAIFGASCIWFIDPRLISVVQRIREIVNEPVIINNWNSGGQYKLSGFRPPSCTIGAKYSQHRYGRAADLKVKSLEPSQVIQIIRDNWDELNALGLSTAEDTSLTASWTHIDIRTTNSPDLLIVGA